MIDWLSAWLKQIILVVLLASFVDLLLPNNAFQRYVKTVLGLFILLTLLSPLLSLFQHKWDPQKLLASVDELGSSAAKIGGYEGQLRSLQSIVADARRIQEDDRQRTVRELERQLAGELQRSLAAERQAAVAKVDVTMSYDNNGTPSIKHMQVVLHAIDDPPGGQERAGESQSRRPIGRVEPVHIEVRLGEQAVKRDDSALTPEQQQAKQRIYELLNKQWQLNRDQVTLLYETELRKEK